MNLISSVKELEALDNAFSAITRGLAIESGTLFRIAYQYLANWGVKVTKDNKEMMEDRVEKINKREWKYGKQLDIMVHRAVARAGLAKDNYDLNTMLADMAAPILDDMDDGKRVFRIADLGAGEGDTSIALLDKLQNVLGRERSFDLANRMDLYLFEPSPDRLSAAYKNIENMPLQPRHLEHGSTISRSFGSIKPISFDIVISSAALHHLPLPDYIHQMREKLVEDGVIVIGDWYHTFCAHPAYTVRLMKNIGADDHRIEEFRKLFGVSDDENWDIENFLKANGFSDSQKSNNEVALLYLTMLADEMKKRREAKIEERERKKAVGMDEWKEDDEKQPRFFFLEALESFSERKKKIEGENFETSINELQAKKIRGFRNLSANIRTAYPGNDITTVIAAAKISRGTKRIKV